MTQRTIIEMTCNQCGRKETEPNELNGWVSAHTIITRPPEDAAGILDRLREEGAVIGDPAEVLPKHGGGDFCTWLCLEQYAKAKWDEPNPTPVEKSNPGQYL